MHNVRNAQLFLMSADKWDPIDSKFISETTIQVMRYYYNIEDSLGVSTVV